jgi:hypothetical protein
MLKKVTQFFEMTGVRRNRILVGRVIPNYVLGKPVQKASG